MSLSNGKKFETIPLRSVLRIFSRVRWKFRNFLTRVVVPLVDFAAGGFLRAQKLRETILLHYSSLRIVESTYTVSLLGAYTVETSSVFFDGSRRVLGKIGISK